MKLYATTTSERAEKSQGGNEYIEVDIFVGNKTREKIGTLDVYIYDKNPECVAVKWRTYKYMDGQTLWNEELPS